MYLGNCAPCHGAAGEGDWLAPQLNVPDVLAKSDEFLRTITLEGIPGTAMIDFETRMDARDVDHIVAFLRTWQPEVRPPQVEDGPGDAIKGAQVYAGSCTACHGADGEGTAVGPAINRKELLDRGAEFVAQVVRDGVANTSMLPYKDRLTDHEINDAIAFVLG